MKKERLSNFELMRIISMIMIIIWHLITRSNILNHCSEIIFLILKFIQYFIIIHVNTFVLLCGYFQYKGKFKLGKVISLLNESLFYRVLFVIIFSLTGLITLSNIDIVKNVFPIDLTNNYWFINCYIALLCLTPFLNKLIANINQREHKSLIIVLILLFSIVPNISYQINLKNDGFTVIQFVLLYFIGSYLSKYPLKDNLHFKNYSKYKKRVILITIMLMAFLFNYFNLIFCNYLISFDNIYLQELGQYLKQGSELYSNIFVLIQSVSGFLIFETFNIKSKFINKVSSLTLGIYLVHENLMVRSWLYKFLKLDVDYTITDFTVIFKILLLSVLIFIICALIEELRSLIFKFISKRKVIIKCKAKFYEILKAF